MSWPALALLEVHGRGLLWVLPVELGGALTLDTTGLELGGARVALTGAEPRVRGAIEGDLDLVLTEGEPQPRAVRVKAHGDLPYDMRGWGWVFVQRDSQARSGSTLILRLFDLALSGRLSEVSAFGEWVEATVAEDPLDDRGLLLHPDATVGPATWPRTDAQRADDGDPSFVGTGASVAASQGSAYPVIIGSPGRGALVGVPGLGPTAVDLPCAPALHVETSDLSTSAADNRVVLCEGRITCTTVTRIFVDSAGSPATEVHTVETGHDALGRLVSYVAPGSALDIPEADSESWWSMNDGEGMANPYVPGPLTRADHVIRWALSRSTLRVDNRSWPRLSALSGLRLDVSVFSQVGAWDWLRSEILPALPIAFTYGPRGLLFTDDLPGGVARYTLSEGRDCTRIAPVQELPRTPITHLVAGFCRDYRANRCARELRVGPDYRATDTTLPSPYAREAFEDFGRRDSAIELPTADLATAQRLALLYVERASRRRYSTEVAVAGPLLRHLSGSPPCPGDVVWLTGGVLARPVLARLASVRYAGDSFILGLRWWADRQGGA